MATEAKGDSRTQLETEAGRPRPSIYSDPSFAARDAIVVPRRAWWGSRYTYRRISFAELGDAIDRGAAGLQRAGVRPGNRIVLLVPFGPDFIALVFAILRTGATLVLIDPGMGMRPLLQCLSEVQPDGFVAVPLAHAVRWWNRRAFPKCRINVTVTPRPGRWCPRAFGGLSPQDYEPVPIKSQAPAAVIFTSGSTGVAKGVLYTHANFEAQFAMIREHYGIQPGGKDLACFPLFGLFNAIFGITTVIPDMKPTRPGQVRPARLVAMINDLQIDQSFASPAVWSVVGRHCERRGVRLPSLRRVLSAGAPVASRILQCLRGIVSPDCEIYTPYGATEALPVASISADEILRDTAAATADGRGICTGRRFANTEWRLIQISDAPLESVADMREVPSGEVGELVVRGAQVTREYITRTEANAYHKIRDDEGDWHRMGDVGYLDRQERFWYCGRKSQRVVTPEGTMFTECCEAIVNQHPAIKRSALVGSGELGRQTAGVICEPWPDDWHWSRQARRILLADVAKLVAAHRLTKTIDPKHIYLRRSLPVDIRHNAKINRECLSAWFTRRLGTRPHQS